jgi:cytochrome P450
MLRKATQKVRKTFRSEVDISIASTAGLEKPKQLEAVIREGLRLSPPVASGVPRVVPKSGATVCGQWVPGGVRDVSGLASCLLAC